MNSDISIAVVGKNEIVREGLRRILVDRGFSIVATSTTAEALAQLVDVRALINLIIIDPQSTGDGLSACRTLRSSFPTAKIVMLGEDHSVRTTLETMSAGADGYLDKQISCEPLARSLDLIAAGEKIVPSQAIQAMILAEHMEHRSLIAVPINVKLSDRELGVLQCLSRGDANKQISRRLEITEATVKVHVKSIMRKLCVGNRTQAAIWAVSRGVAPSPLPVSAA